MPKIPQNHTGAANKDMPMQENEPQPTGHKEEPQCNENVEEGETSASNSTNEDAAEITNHYDAIIRLAEGAKKIEHTLQVDLANHKGLLDSTVSELAEARKSLEVAKKEKIQLEENNSNIQREAQQKISALEFSLQKHGRQIQSLGEELNSTKFSLKQANSNLKAATTYCKKRDLFIEHIETENGSLKKKLKVMAGIN